MIPKPELRFADHLFFLKPLLIASIEGLIVDLYKDRTNYLLVFRDS